MSTGPDPTDRGRVAAFLHWYFYSPEHDRYVVAMFPNLLLFGFLGARVLEWAVRSNSLVESLLQWVGTGCLVAWALDELVRGVNPFRRTLGLAVLLWQTVAWLA